MENRYPTLLSEHPLGPKTARNRTWMLAHGTQLVRDHNFSQAHVDYYAERARNGIAVITMEAMAVHPTTQPYEGKIFAFDRRIIPNYREIASAVQAHGTLLLAQLWHRGRQTDSLVSRLPVWAPSAVPCTLYREMPHEMTQADIEELVEGYVTSAENAVEGGLDGIEVHGLAHGYLLGQFLSPATNHRTDEYGGSFDDRMRLVLEIIRRVREVTPSDRILGVRVNGDDGEVEGGLRPDNWARISSAIVSTGMVDYVSVSQGTYMNRMLIYGSAPTPAGHQLDATAIVRHAVPQVPVVAAGRITTPELAERLLTDGTADFVGLARPLIADAEWLAKAASGRDQEIRPCVGANWCMTSIVKAPLACVHNPAVGRERELGTGTLVPAKTPRRIAVVGAGPAGLRAAYTASARGHEVTLFERESEPGGQVRWIGQVTSYREWRGITDWLLEQIEDSAVTLRLGEEPPPDTLATFDDVVLATGSVPLRHGWTALRASRWGDDAPTLPGADQFNVLTIPDVFNGTGYLGPRVMVVDDQGDRQATAVAEYLAERRHTVEIVTRLGSVAPELANSRDVGAVHTRLRRAGVTFTRDHELVGIEDDRVDLRDVHTGEVVARQPVDSVVLVLGNRANDLLRGPLQDVGVHAHVIGDAAAPRRIFNAIWEAEQLARRL